MDTPDHWQPITDRGWAAVEDDTLHEGVPGWLLPALRSWIISRIFDDRGLETEVVQVFRIDGGGRTDEVGLVSGAVGDDPEFALDTANLALHRTEKSGVIDDLEKHLYRSGSAWRAVMLHGRGALVRRVPEEVQDRARQVADVDDPAGRHLAAAWRAMYGRNPNADTAADEAVSALEWALTRLATPDDRDATLGKAAKRLREVPNLWDWPLDPRRGDGADHPVRTVGELAAQVLATHRRHAEQGDGRPPQTPAEAEVIVHVAMTIVHAIREGLLRRQ